jgi:hypothetical protein
MKVFKVLNFCLLILSTSCVSDYFEKSDEGMFVDSNAENHEYFLESSLLDGNVNSRLLEDTTETETEEETDPCLAYEDCFSCNAVNNCGWCETVIDICMSLDLEATPEECSELYDA